MMKGRCWFIVNITNDILTRLTLADLMPISIMIISSSIAQYYQMCDLIYFQFHS